MKLYYRIWVDAIKYEQSKRNRESGWKTMLMVYISILQGLNLLVLLYILRWLSGRRMPIVLPWGLFHNRGYDAILSLILTFFIPFVILNYLLIYYNDRYKKLMASYPDSGGKLYGRYAMISLGLIVVPVVLKFVF